MWGYVLSESPYDNVTRITKNDISYCTKEKRSGGWRTDSDSKSACLASMRPKFPTPVLPRNKTTTRIKKFVYSYLCLIQSCTYAPNLIPFYDKEIQNDICGVHLRYR
jgi:hypothetical protein